MTPKEKVMDKAKIMYKKDYGSLITFPRQTIEKIISLTIIEKLRMEVDDLYYTLNKNLKEKQRMILVNLLEKKKELTISECENICRKKFEKIVWRIENLNWGCMERYDIQREVIKIIKQELKL